jgi:hypothetical protein
MRHRLHAEISQDREVFERRFRELVQNNIDELSPVCPRKFTRREPIE